MSSTTRERPTGQVALECRYVGWLHAVPLFIEGVTNQDSTTVKAAAGPNLLPDGL